MVTKSLSVEDKVNVIKSFAEEIINEEELKELFKTKKKIVAYDGFEPSGQIHIAQALLRALTVNKMTSLGIHFKFWVADWFGMLNNKQGGDLEKIKLVGEYFIEVWKACGLDMKNVEFIWASDFIKEHPEYWETVLKLSMNASVNRVLRCGQIMGREESTNNPSAQILYPLMQASDIHHLGADIAQLGLDQRKVNMLARDIFPKLGLKPPVAVHHHMLLGLKEPGENKIIIDKVLKKDEIVNLSDDFIFKFKGIKKRESLPDYVIKSFDNEVGKKGEYVNLEVINNEGKEIGGFLQQPFDAEWIQEDLSGNVFFILFKKNKKGVFIRVLRKISEMDRKIELKMSKSKPNTAIFMTDSKEDIFRKFKKAYCPEKIEEDNPVLEYAKYIVFEKYKEIIISRDEKFGGDLKIKSYEELRDLFVNGDIHPVDLKNTIAKYIDEMIEPVRQHFEKDKNARELLKKVKALEVTR